MTQKMKEVSNCSAGRDIEIDWNESDSAYVFLNNLTTIAAVDCYLREGDLGKSDSLRVTTFAGMSHVTCHSSCNRVIDRTEVLS